MEIRRARDEDYVEMAALRRSTIRSVNANDYPEHVIASWSATTDAEDLLESSSRCLRWVARDRNMIVGFCEHTRKCEISRLYVHKDHLRRGVGSSLLNVAEESLRRRGCVQVRVESTVTAKAFYEVHGYEVNERASWDGDASVPVYIMSRRITP
jgi:putative acetyltransferase